MQPSGPIARFEDLVTTASGDDLLVYDTVCHHVHHLNPVAAAVWRSCNGRRSVADLAGEASRELGVRIDPDAVRVALAQLADADLLTERLDPAMRVSGRTRRSFLRRAAVAGIAAPVIASVTAPQAAAQISCETGFVPCGIGPCCEEGKCQNGMCCFGDVCENGQCCMGGTCVGGTCCSNVQICNGQCCSNGLVCKNGACCPPSVPVCGDDGFCCFGECYSGGCCLGEVCGGEYCCSFPFEKCVEGACVPA